jgi:transcriptional regulator with XRE-family HTH domain
MKRPKANGMLWAAVINRGLRFRDYAKILGRDPATVSKVVRGRMILDPSEQVIWARALDMEPEQLFPDE